MAFGNMPNDGGGLLIKNLEDVNNAISKHGVPKELIRPFIGSDEAIDGKRRYCLWMSDAQYRDAIANDWLSNRITSVENHRSSSDRDATKKLAATPFKFGEVRQTGNEVPVIIPRHSSENREYLPFAVGSRGDIVADSASAFYDVPLWNLAIYSSRLHLTWIATVCGALETRYRYSSTLGWNTFPVPQLTEQNQIDLTRCVEDILLAREANFPSSIAELYEPDEMPESLRQAHLRNDEVVERIYIGRRFKNDTERLEKLFELYTKMTAAERAKPAAKIAKGRKKTS